jgi:hypothetical protein
MGVPHGNSSRKITLSGIRNKSHEQSQLKGKRNEEAARYGCGRMSYPLVPHTNLIAQAPVPYAVVAPLIASIQQQCANHTVADDPQPMVPRVVMKEA